MIGWVLGKLNEHATFPVCSLFEKMRVLTYKDVMESFNQNYLQIL